MTKIDSFERSTVRALGAEGVSELQAFANKYGLTVRYAGARFGAAEATIKFVFGVTKTVAAPSMPAGTRIMTTDEINFRRYASMFGLEPDDFGRQFTFMGQTYILTGLKPSRHKYPISGRGVRGGNYKFPMSAAAGVIRPPKIVPNSSPATSAFAMPPSMPSEEAIDIEGADW